MRDDTAPKVIDLMAALRDSLRRERDNTTGGTGTMTGAERIAAERQRQIEVEGYTAQEDEEYIDGELAGAGAAYAELAHRQIAEAPLFSIKGRPPGQTWRWGHAAWRPSEDPLRNLEKAGALIAAEIDRLLRERGEVP